MIPRPTDNDKPIAMMFGRWEYRSGERRVSDAAAVVARGKGGEGEGDNHARMLDGNPLQLQQRRVLPPRLRHL